MDPPVLTSSGQNAISHYLLTSSGQEWQLADLLWPGWIYPPLQHWWIKNRCLEYCYTKLVQMNLLWPIDPSRIIEHRCLEYWYTKIGRSKPDFGWWNFPLVNRESRCNLNTCYTKTWQTNLLWLIDPQWIKNRCLEYCYSNLGRWTYFVKNNGPPSESRIDALNTATPNLADKCTLANGPPSTDI